MTPYHCWSSPSARQSPGDATWQHGPPSPWQPPPAPHSTGFDKQGQVAGGRTPPSPPRRAERGAGGDPPLPERWSGAGDGFLAWHFAGNFCPPLKISQKPFRAKLCQKWENTSVQSAKETTLGLSRSPLAGGQRCGVLGCKDFVSFCIIEFLIKLHKKGVSQEDALQKHWGTKGVMLGQGTGEDGRVRECAGCWRSLGLPLTLATPSVPEASRWSMVDGSAVAGRRRSCSSRGRLPDNWAATATCWRRGLAAHRATAKPGRHPPTLPPPQPPETVDKLAGSADHAPFHQPGGGLLD